MMWGLPAAFSTKESDPLRVPVATGVNVTAMLQLAPAATDVPQLFTAAKSPLGVMLVIASGSPPVLVSDTSCAGDVVLSVWAPNVSDDGKIPIPEASGEFTRGRDWVTTAD